MFCARSDPALTRVSRGRRNVDLDQVARLRTTPPPTCGAESQAAENQSLPSRYARSMAAQVALSIEGVKLVRNAIALSQEA